jgi:hypothetical protein
MAISDFCSRAETIHAGCKRSQRRLLFYGQRAISR